MRPGGCDVLADEIRARTPRWALVAEVGLYSRVTIPLWYRKHQSTRGLRKRFEAHIPSPRAWCKAELAHLLQPS